MAEMNSNGRAAGRVRLRSILCCLGIGALFASLQAAPADRQLETITVEAKRQLEHQVDQFVQTVVVHHFGEALMRWDTAVCPLVAGLSKEQGEFVLQRLSVAAKNAGAPLAPEKCAANFFVLVTSKADQILKELKQKSPRLFDTRHGVGGLQHFMATERPVRVWYNSEDEGDAGAGLAVVAAFIGGSGTSGGGVTGLPSPSAAGSASGSYRMPNSRLTLTVQKNINSVIIVVDLPQMSGVNVGQMADYAAVVGLADINLDRTVDSAPSILRLFSDRADTPRDGMSPWDQALLKSLYSTSPRSVTQLSAVETKMVENIIAAQH
jgi:hypothetical protein